MVFAATFTGICAFLLGVLLSRAYYRHRRDQPRVNGKFVSKNLNKAKPRQPYTVIPPEEQS